MCGKASSAVVAEVGTRLKAGDKAVVQNTGGLTPGFAKVGDVVTITWDDGVYYKGENSVGETNWLEPDQLILAPEAEVETTPESVAKALQEFKLGDAVVLVANSEFETVLAGDRGTIVEVDNDELPYRVESETTGKAGWVRPSQIKLVEEPTPEPVADAPQFKIGDKVVITVANTMDEIVGFPVGTKATIVDMDDPAYDSIPFKLENDEGETRFFGKSTFELDGGESTSAPEFKIGDKVEILASDGGSPDALHHTLPVGSIGEIITEPRLSEVHGTLVDVRGDHPFGGDLVQAVSISNLKLVEPKAELQFKVGDRVQLANTPDDADYGADGQIVTITDVDADDINVYQVEDANGRTGWLEAQHVAPLDPESVEPKFAVGDKVLTPAGEGTVESISTEGYKINFGCGSKATYQENQLRTPGDAEVEAAEEPVEEAAPTTETTAPVVPKVGDWVRVDGSSGHYFPDGTLGTISVVYGGGSAVDVQPDEGTIMTDGKEAREQYLITGDYTILPAEPELPRPFQPGDRVEVTGNSNGHDFEIGSVRTLDRVDPVNYHDANGTRWYTEGNDYIVIRESDFKLASSDETAEEPTAESGLAFKVGDRVVLTRRSEDGEFKRGTEVTVVKVDEDDTNLPYKVEDAEGEYDWVKVDGIAPLGTPIPEEVEFQLGDKVYVKDGILGVVVSREVDADGDIEVKYVDEDEGSYDYFTPDEVTLAARCPVPVESQAGASI